MMIDLDEEARKIGLKMNYAKTKHTSNTEEGMKSQLRSNIIKVK